MDDFSSKVKNGMASDPPSLTLLLRQFALACNGYFDKETGEHFVPQPSVSSDTTSVQVFEIPQSWVVKENYEHWELVNLA
eukprot:scaffold14755_cov157-Amphora_coffeaeformis.AAC.3